MINQKYSFKNFTNIVMTDAKVEELNNTEIIGSCFYQEGVPNRHIFPENMIDVIFKRCNLDNVFIPLGNTLDEDCTNKNILVQNDWEDWILDSNLKPIEPIRKKEFVRLGISIDPQNIPVQKWTMEQRKDFEKTLKELKLSIQ